INYKSGRGRDPFDTFDYLMDLSEKKYIKSRFYFLPTVFGEKDARYDIRDPEVTNLIQHIEDRGHVVGVHGSLSAFNNGEVFKHELERLGVSSGNIRE